MPKQDAELEEILIKYWREDFDSDNLNGNGIEKAKAALKLWRDKSVNEARIEELSSIDYGCEDSDENEIALDIVMNNATSNIDGRSLRGRLKHLRHLNKKGEE